MSEIKSVKFDFGQFFFSFKIHLILFPQKSENYQFMYEQLHVRYASAEIGHKNFENSHEIAHLRFAT